MDSELDRRKLFSKIGMGCSAKVIIFSVWFQQASWLAIFFSQLTDFQRWLQLPIWLFSLQHYRIDDIKDMHAIFE